MLERLNKMCHWRVMAFTFSLMTAAFPVAISQAKGIQVTKSLVYHAMIPLLDQIRSMGTNVNMEITADGAILTIGDKTYVYSNMQQINGVASGSVSVFDSVGNWMHDVDVSISSGDPNFLNWDANYYANDIDGNAVEYVFTNGVLEGTGTNNAALVVDVDGREHAAGVDYSDIANAVSDPIQLAGWHATDGFRYEPIQLVAAAVVIIAIVGLVLIACAFEWFGLCG